MKIKQYNKKSLTNKHSKSFTELGKSIFPDGLFCFYRNFSIFQTQKAKQSTLSHFITIES